MTALAFDLPTIALLDLAAVATVAAVTSADWIAKRGQR